MTATDRDPRCGTPAGYAAHYRAREAQCDECRKAHNVRMAAHRAEHGQPSSKARGRALRQLSHEYPHRFAELYEQHKAAVFAEQRASGGTP